MNTVNYLPPIAFPVTTSLKPEIDAAVNAVQYSKEQQYT